LGLNALQNDNGRFSHTNALCRPTGSTADTPIIPFFKKIIPFFFLNKNIHSLKQKPPLLTKIEWTNFFPPVESFLLGIIQLCAAPSSSPRAILAFLPSLTNCEVSLLASQLWKYFNSLI
jgi:hypothetical protein